MKTLIIVLLGFAGLLPATCSKEKMKEQSEARPAKTIDSVPYRTDIALYGPAIIVVKSQQAQQRTA
jgi:hypothetical protein